MHPSGSLRLLGVPGFAVTAAAMFLAILGQAIAGSYMALFAVERASMGPLELGAFLTLSAISGIAVTALLGRWFDRSPTLWPTILCLAATIVGYGLCSVVESRWALMVIAFLLIGPALSAFASLIALAKGHLDREGPLVSGSGMAALRMMASVSWAVGPAVGALLIGLWSYAGVFAGASACGALALLAVVASRPQALRPEPSEHDEAPLGKLAGVLALPAIALALFHWVIFMGSNAQSIVTISVLGGSERDVGLLFSLCAALEVVVMAVFVVRPASHASRTFLAAGFLIYTAFFVIPLLWPTLAAMYWAQLPRAVGIGIISVLGMQFVQQLLPRHPGAASALFGNTIHAGFLLSGIATGGWAAGFGYWSMFGLCAALSLAGAALFLLAGRSEDEPGRTPPP